uniref:Uncharacterized protein n=1 Tax=Spumella elongata TaxID=89044 RepID=A0A7S3H7N8_9STRA|mmetsp:Transcript_39010/g.67524  ORF Transcript_39010/g.67524 Transcript_39010/m.67524 type:complete len:559 (+) Transcript_39010:3-1679(+)
MSFLVKSALLCLLGAQTVYSTALDDYVWKPDSNYGWVDMGPEYQFNNTIGPRSYQAYTLNMTSQRWLTDADFSEGSQSGSIWWHYLVVIVPDNVQFTRNATIWITGGNMGNSAPHSRQEDVIVSAALATTLGTITGILYQIPNEHTTFSSDPIQKSRTEDAVIAFTWDHFLKDPSNPEWLLRFPMVKASLRAMDTITEYVKIKRPELNTQLDYYSVSGASKRGWTTWDVGAVDPARVQAIVPVVLDAINFAAVEHHQYRSYGGWTYALQDYIDMNITERFDDPNMVHLQENVDPFWYASRLTMPKMVVNAAMDEFQQPDDTDYWWAQMPGPKRFLMLPNTEHSLATGILEAVPAIGAFLGGLLNHVDVPGFEWEISPETGDIVATLHNQGKVHSAHMWYAHSCGVNTFDKKRVNRRDFRVMHLDSPCTCGPVADGYCVNLKTFWSKKELEMKEVHGKRTYTAHVDTPTDGTYTAFLIDIKFVNKHGVPMDVDAIRKQIVVDPSKPKTIGAKIAEKFPEFGGFPHDFGGFFEFTSQVSVWPNTFPYPDCSGVECGNRVV